MCSAAMDQPDEAIDAVEPPPPPPPPPPPALEGGRIFPRNGPRGERCKVCNQMRERATIKAHTESCIYSRKGMLCQQPAWGLLADGQAVNLLVAALPQQTTRLMLTFLDEVEHIYHQCGHHVSLRPDHRGVMFGIGVNPRTRQRFGPANAYPVVQRKVEDLWKHVKELPVIRMAMFAIRKMMEEGDPSVGLRMTFPPSSFDEGGMNCFCSWDYSPVRPGGALDHTAPDAVRHEIKGMNKMPGGCRIMDAAGNATPCPTCTSFDENRAEQHNACDDCCLHTDKRDRSVTILLGFQRVMCEASKRAVFCHGYAAWQMKGGMIWIFSGKERHGVWAPPNADEYWGVAFVKRV